MDAFVAISWVVYLLLARLVIRRAPGLWRERWFAVLNLAAFYVIFGQPAKSGVLFFAAYVGLLLFQYGFLALMARRGGWLFWPAVLLPILALVVVRYVPISIYEGWGGPWARLFAARPSGFMSACFLGISYMAFRSSRLVVEVRNGAVALPSLARYLAFCFFLPTMSVGPISPFALFDKAFQGPPPDLCARRAGLRMLVGLVKYLYLGNLCQQLAYSGLLRDGQLHAWPELGVAAVFYYLFLYLNFSGYCDFAIGAAGWMGIEVAENFDRPLSARNVKEFWNRWHITLSTYMRDVVFSPLSKYLAGLMGPQRVNDAVAVTIVIVFLIVGVWHGAGWNFAAFGALHALGVVANHYYTIYLKKLGRERFKAYQENPWIRRLAVALTFLYVAASLFFFAHSFPGMRDVLALMR
jgi:D-alanyl-lipoteichoic acid acyltransferase DltB (MBOAT superfamily)